MAVDQSLSQTTTEDTAKEDRPLTHNQKRFYASTLCVEARGRLQALVDSPDYNTDPSRLSDEAVSFVERHLYHLSIHPQTNLNGYISNLKLMTNTGRSRATR